MESSTLADFVLVGYLGEGIPVKLISRRFIIFDYLLKQAVSKPTVIRVQSPIQLPTWFESPRLSCSQICVFDIVGDPRRARAT